MAPLVFGHVADFPADYAIDDSEFARVIAAASNSKRRGMLFESRDLMATTAWFAASDD